MENFSQNGFLKQQTPMNFQPSPIIQIQTTYEHGSSSSGVSSCNKPPLPRVDGTHVLPITNQTRIQAAVSATQASIGRISSMTDQQLVEYEQKNGRNIPENVDVKKLKRTIANRLSAQKSRLMKSQKIEEMENKIKELKGTIKATKTQMESTRNSKEVLHMQNIMLKQQLDYASKKLIRTNITFKKNDAEARWLRRWRQIVKQNALIAEKKKMESLLVHHEQLPPNIQIHQPFKFIPNPGVSDKFSNMEAVINNQPSTNPAS